MTREPGSMTPSLVPLPLDSRLFGWPVARLDERRLDDHRLRHALASAREHGCRLVYWFADPACEPSEALLREFSGMQVDRRVTFRRALPVVAGGGMPPGGSSAPSGLSLEVWPVGEPSPSLVSLALEAGIHSRFARDPRMPIACFRTLYEAWIRNSTRHQIADMVFVGSNPRDDLVGFITVGLRDAPGAPVAEGMEREAAPVGSIGLVAVAGHARRRGVGRWLLRSACDWVAQAGGRAIEVVTQGDNGPAMALYEREGFHQVALSHVYHFWPAHPAADAVESASGTERPDERG